MISHLIGEFIAMILDIIFYKRSWRNHEKDVRNRNGRYRKASESIKRKI
ncbi:hypothetical protein PDM92_21315 [Bacillus cereus]|nr:hypothetical protein [Bacillus cereus]